MKTCFSVTLARGARHWRVRRDMKRRYRSRAIELLRLFARYMRREGALEIFGSAREVLRAGCYTKIRNRCVYSGKARGVYRRYKMSRVSFRELCLLGEIPGFRKASW
jgi:small subunit ribosomal protein S14